MKEQGTLGHWLSERCHREHLSLRQATARTGLSHTTLANIIKGGHPLPETIKKLAEAFGEDGPNQRLALQDHLLVLAGYRSERPEEEPSELMAQLKDKVRGFTDPQLKMMEHFANYIKSIEGDNEGDNNG